LAALPHGLKLLLLSALLLAWLAKVAKNARGAIGTTHGSVNKSTRPTLARLVLSRAHRRKACPMCRLMSRWRHDADRSSVVPAPLSLAPGAKGREPHSSLQQDGNQVVFPCQRASPRRLQSCATHCESRRRGGRLQQRQRVKKQLRRCCGRRRWWRAARRDSRDPPWWSQPCTIGLVALADAELGAAALGRGIGTIAAGGARLTQALGEGGSSAPWPAIWQAQGTWGADLRRWLQPMQWMILIPLLWQQPEPKTWTGLALSAKSRHDTAL